MGWFKQKPPAERIRFCMGCFENMPLVRFYDEETHVCAERWWREEIESLRKPIQRAVDDAWERNR